MCLWWGLKRTSCRTKSIEQGGEISEERRLCYVGITRARQRLWMSFARQRGSAEKWFLGPRLGSSKRSPMESAMYDDGTEAADARREL